MDSAEVDRLAQLLFEYQISSNKLEHCAAMLVFGSHDERVAHYAAKLYRQGWSSKIVFTGGLGRITKRLWYESEADRFARIAEQEQVPASAILRENKSRNTAENIRNTQKLLKQEGLEEKKLLVIERPYRALRTRVTLTCQWPKLDFIISSLPLTYEEYAHWYESGRAPISKHEFISILVGDTQRNLIYPSRGWQDPVEIPEAILSAAHELARQGYTEQLLSDVGSW